MIISSCGVLNGVCGLPKIGLVLNGRQGVALEVLRKKIKSYLYAFMVHAVYTRNTLKKR